MNKDQKLLFFDIDGTLLTAYPWTIPDSTQQALKAARKNGHLLFINSGRTYTMLPDMIREMNFDGYVCGCGSQIYLHDKLLLSSSIPSRLLSKAKAGFPPALNDRIKFCMTVLPVICRMLYKS